MLKRREGFVVTRAALLSAAALGVLISACGSAKMGTVGEDCYPNGTCNETLVCRAGKCVADNGGSGGNGGGSGGSGGAATTSSSSSTTSSSSSTTSSSGAGGGTTSSSSSSGAPANAPQILVLGTNVDTITEGESVTFTAVVTDPDGIDDVIGGTLSDGNGNYFGAFATTGQEGAYQMTLSWGQISQVTDIEFANGADPQRSFIAEFFDQAGHSAQKSAAVTLTCDGIGACASQCTDRTKDSQNCGTCGLKCTGGAYCGDSNCVGILASCQLKFSFTSCDALCISKGKTCGNYCKGSGTNPVGGVGYYSSCTGSSYDMQCNTTFPGSVTTVACCCY